MVIERFSNQISAANFCQLYDVLKTTIYYLVGKYKDSVLAGHIIKRPNKSQSYRRNRTKAEHYYTAGRTA